MTWPTPQDYNEAIQNPHLNFADEELKCGVPEVNALGLPQPSTGAFASAYRIKCEDRDVAVRCFLQPLADRRERYRALSDALHGVSSELFVNFDYVEQGIRVRNTWYPIVKMDWIQGKTLDAFLRDCKEESDSVAALLESFRSACDVLKEAGIAHGDLQHGNLIVSNGTLRLIDYDGMYVPAIAALGSNELGHPNYQHPGRNKYLFSPTMDNFSAWIIHESLSAIAEAPDLIPSLRGCEECLLLRHMDYAHPTRSPAFHLMEKSENDKVKECGRKLRAICQMEPDAIPALSSDAQLPEPQPLAERANVSILNSLVPASDDAQAELKLPENETDLRPINSAQGLPSVRDYAQAIRLPRIAFSDPELQQGRPLQSQGALWRALGRESVVFGIEIVSATGTKRYAIKCFLGSDRTREQRYELAEAYYKRSMPWKIKKHFVEFDYQAQGINIHGSWHPIVKMAWVTGPALDEYISSTPHKSNLAYSVVQEWRELLDEMHKAGIAHGNLEPSNVVVHDGRLRLIDYDTLYTPNMSKQHFEHNSSTGIDFMHPRAGKQVGPWTDNFQSWLIDTGLLTWFMDPAIYRILGYHQGQLLFRSADLQDPANSKLFALLHHNHHEELKARAELLYRFLYTAPAKIPPLQAKALSLLPSAVVQEYKLRKIQVSGRVATITFSIIALMVLTALPHGSMMALVPTVALLLTVAGLLREHRKESGTTK